MKTRLIIGASAYAVIESDDRRMDILLAPGRSAAQSLRESVADIRAKAAADLSRADFIESAIHKF